MYFSDLEAREICLLVCLFISLVLNRMSKENNGEGQLKDQ